MNRIDLISTLPNVFGGMEAEAAIARSQVWLVDLSFVKPQSYIVEAESGAGKSSLCSFLYGLRSDYTGSILFDGEDVDTFSVGRWSRIRQREIAYLPQEMRLFPELTVGENIDIKNRLTHHRPCQWISEALEKLEVAGKVNEKAGRLSVGQQQRVAIVRALCQPFSFLLVDEPVSHLDMRNNALVAALISETAAAEGASVIATSVGNKLSIDFDNRIVL